MNQKRGPMVVSDLERIEAELRSIRKALEQLQTARPEGKGLFRFPDAARMLGVGRDKLRRLVKAHVVLTSPLGARPMISGAEIARLTHAVPGRYAEQVKAHLAKPGKKRKRRVR
jgi:hypothetical protein